jgi:NAD(P)-dependent dehydrogenase (short-subunit alcohol dehydrogenase family)
MQEFRGRTAVVTGAASGIGRALCEKFAALGMNVVLADVEGAKAEAVASELATDSLVVATDVSDATAVERLAERSCERFGAVHVLCNNAGVFAGGSLWDAPLSDYEWVLGVNTWGVIHGVHSFVPRMIEHGEPAHVVNTSSMAGLTSLPFSGIYHMSKHAVVALSECLHHELALANTRVGVSVLCPELIATQIHRAERNRPASLRGPEPGAVGRTARELVGKAIAAGVEAGLPPAVIAERVVAAIRDERFYILAEDRWREACNLRLDDVRAGRNPTFAPPQA